MHKEIVVEGLGHPEGPAVLPDGRVAFVEGYRSRVSVWSPDHGVRLLADTGGGPNACILGGDDHLYVTQNGGTVGPWRAEVQGPPSIQRVSLSGAVEVVATEVGGVTLNAPNDLAIGADGRLYFTDPGEWDQENRPYPGYILALDADGTGEVLAELDHSYPNGIVVEADGSVVWVESYTRRVVRRRPDGTVETLHQLAEGHIPDGLAVAADGSLYVTTFTSGGLDVLAHDGAAQGFLDLDPQRTVVPSNCAFDGTSLYVTDMGALGGTTATAHYTGRLWRVQLEVAGMPLFHAAAAS